MVDLRQRAVRRGITLIEILFAIGIVVIGVFGIMALLMLAGVRARQSIDANFTAAASSQALTQLAVRGWQRGDLVLLLTNSGWQTLENTVALRRTAPAQFRQVFYDGRINYCLDPLFVSHRLASGGAMTSMSPESRFPYGGSGRTIPELTMPRATASSQAGMANPIGVAVAERHVGLPDDLRFDFPEDRTLLPQQVFEILPSSPPQSPQPGRRANQGQFTWFATVTPGLDMAAMQSSRLTYVVSVVIVKSRDPRYRDAKGNVRSAERQVTVRRLLGNGQSGGTLEVLGQSAEELAVQRGRWVMMSGLYIPDPAQPSNLVAYHAWYRVIGRTEPEFDSALSTWKRFLTLEGPDWPLAKVQPGSMRLTIVDNAVSVSSKTFRFERSDSPW